MKKKQIIGLVIAVALFIVTGVASVVTNTLTTKFFGSDLLENAKNLLEDELEFDPPVEDYIGVVQIMGTIEEQQALSLQYSQSYRHNTLMDYVDELIADDNNKGMLLYVDSPGGAVYESEEMYLKLKEYKEKTNRPIWCYMSHYAASGGYMVSLTADKIYANPNTVTGSIGVIMSGYDMSGLYEKLGIRYVSITSGENKDSSQLNDDQIDIYQSQVDECYEAFVAKVMDGRDMSEKQVKKLADGRTYTAKQAKENGLIDEISLYDDMKGAMSEELGTREFYTPEFVTDAWSSIFAQASSLIPKSEAQVLKETADGMESGVLMYYAEQLR